MEELRVINEQEVLGKNFRVYGTPEHPLFLARDVAEWIDYAKTGQGYYDVAGMLRAVDEDERLKMRTTTNNRSGSDSWFLTEDGLYEVLMQSRRPIAKKFKKKVKEILKDIRKHGMYAEDELLDNPDLLLKVVTKLKVEREAKKLAEQKVCELETELDRNKDWYSIKRVAALNGVDWKKFDWRKLKQTGEKMGYGVKKIFDANYGEVNTYHRDVWEKVYPEYEL